MNFFLFSLLKNTCIITLFLINFSHKVSGHETSFTNIFSSKNIVEVPVLEIKLHFVVSIKKGQISYCTLDERAY